MFKRLALFLATNLAVMVLLGIVLTIVQRVFGITLGNNGVLLVMAAVLGFGGALFSLAISKWSAKAMTRMRIVDGSEGADAAWLVGVVRRQAEAAGIRMPEVGVYDGPELNAFATGPSRNNALVAVSTGLLRGMERAQVEAVLGHEITHVANGDMVTMTLIQGVLNTFVIFLARTVGRVADAALGGARDPDAGPGPMYWVIVMVLDVVFGLLANLIAMWFSRWREFRADAGGAALAGRGKMISALERLAANQGVSTLPTAVKAFGISGAVAHGIRKLFMTHPPLAERIQALRDAAVVDTAAVR